MHRIMLAAGLAALLLTPPHLGEAGPDPLTCSVQGNVTEATIGSALENGVMLLESVPAGLYADVAYTDAAGDYAFALVPPGTYVLRLYEPDWQIGAPPTARGSGRRDYVLDGMLLPIPNPYAGTFARPAGDPPSTDPFEVFEPGMPRTVDFPGDAPTAGGGDTDFAPLARTNGVAGWVVRPIGRLGGGVGGITTAPFDEPVGGIDVILNASVAGFPRMTTSFASGAFVFDDVVGFPLSDFVVTLPGFSQTIPATILTLVPAGDTVVAGTVGPTGDVTVVGINQTGPVVDGPALAWAGLDRLIFVLPARLGGFAGRAFVERGTPNALFDPTDLPLPGRTIRLLLASDPLTVLATTVTDTDGTYAFPDQYEDDAYLLQLVTPGAPTSLRVGTLSAAESDPVDFIYVPANCPDGFDPVIQCPADMTVECTDPAGAVVSFAATATDDCTPDEQIVITYAPQGPDSTFALGTTTITATAQDLAGRTSQCMFDVTVEDTEAPVITLNGASTLTLECGVDAYDELGATAADDCDDNLPPITIDDSAVNTNMTGTYIVTYDVRDASMNDALTVERTVIVEDTRAPVITSTLSRSVLWPPSRGLFPAGFTATALDACDGPVGVVMTVFSNEDHGPGPYAPDTMGTTPPSLRLRSERAYPPPPGGFGRFYLVRVAAGDGAGNTAAVCHATIVPTVPTTMTILGLRAQAAAFEAACVALPPSNSIPGLQTLQAPAPQPQ